MSDEFSSQHDAESGAPAESSKGVSFIQAGDDGKLGPSLDPAQESLASALNLTFRFVQLVMVLVGIAFLISGVQTIGESERGIKLVFGKITASDVEPGIRWNWPYPLGEIEKIRTSQESVDLGYTFMPNLNARERTMQWAQIANTRQRLNPGQDGSVVTADGAIAHLEVSVTFHRADPVANATNIYSVDEMAIVRSAVERGVVATVAQVPIDRLLRQAGTDDTGMGSLEARVRRAAQDMLDVIESGIRIDNVNIRDPRPPLAVYREFDAVARAEAEASKQREDANRAYRQTLTDIAGEAHVIILDRIDAYERAIELNDDALAEQVLDEINSLLEGAAVDIDGQSYEGLTSGLVTQILNSARQYRTDVVESARSRAEIFNAKLDQFRTDPTVLVTSDWTRAFREFLENGLYETIILPGGADGDFMLTPDPDIPKLDEARKNRQQAEDNVQSRIEEITERHRQWSQEQRQRDRDASTGGS